MPVSSLKNGAHLRYAPLGLALVAACSGSTSTSTTTTTPTPSNITVVSGANQSVGPGEPVPLAPVVRLVDKEGAPVSGAILDLAAAGNIGVVASASVVTDATGQATLPRWQAPLSAGDFYLDVTLHAALSGPTTPVTARIHATVVDPGTVLVQQLIGQVGGTITVVAPASPLNGLTITVPAAGLPSAATFSVSAHPAPALPAGMVAASPLILVDDGGITADSLVRIRVPMARSQGGIPIVVAVTADNEFIPVTALASDSTSMTVVLRQFAALPPASSRLTSLTPPHLSGPGVQLIAVDATLPTSGTVQIGFRLGVDDLEFENDGSQWQPGGYCTGWSALAGWQFMRTASSGAARTAFPAMLSTQDAPGWPLRDQLNPAIRLATWLQTNYGTNTASDLLGWWGLISRESPSLTWSNILAQLFYSRTPVMLVIHTDAVLQGSGWWPFRAGESHAVLAYKVDLTGTGGLVYVADPNYPGAARVISYNSTTSTFDPYPGAPAANGQPALYTQFGEATYFFREQASAISAVVSQYAANGLLQAYPPVSARINTKSGQQLAVDQSNVNVTVQSRDNTLRLVTLGQFGNTVNWDRLPNADGPETWGSATLTSPAPELPIKLATGLNRIGLVFYQSNQGVLLWQDAKLLTVTRLPPALSFSRQPSNGIPNLPLSQVQVTLVDEDGNPVPESRQVALQLTGGAAGAVLAGGTASTGPNGTATFSNLVVDRVGSGYKLTATSPGLTAMVSSSFDISAAPTPDFSIQVAPLAATVAQGGTATYTVTLTSLNGFAGSVALAALNIPLNLVLAGTGFTSSNVALTPNGSATSTLTLVTGSATQTGPTTVTVQGTSGQTVHSTPITVTVNPVNVLAAPTLTAPVNGTGGNPITPTFSWSAVAGANRYWLLVATSPAVIPTDPAATSCAACIVSGVTSLTTHTLPNAFPNSTGGGLHPTLAAGTLYYWKVQGFNTDGTLGQYSAASSFTTAAAGAPSIHLDRTLVPFNFTVGGTLPPLQTVTVSNGGSGTLTGLSVSAISYIGPQTGWLVRTLTDTTATTNVSFIVLPSSLPTGTFSATVQVSSTAPGLTGGSQTITVTITVSPQASAPSIHLGRTTVPFTYTIGSPLLPAVQVDSVTNGGTGTLTGLSLGAVTYTPGQPTGWIGLPIIGPDAPTVVSLGVFTFLPAGTYSATIQVFSTAPGLTGGPQTITVTLAVQASAGVSFVEISTRANNSCGLTQTGAVYCWGPNDSGELGDGTTTQRLVPTMVTGGISFAKISAGLFHTCGLTQAGAAYCWGGNNLGQLGDGTSTQRLVPTPVTGGINFAEISAGGGSVCGLTQAGAAYCWGYNSNGQLGDGTVARRPVPAIVTGGLNFSGVSTGSDGHACAISQSGAAYCWGANNFAQLGDGTTTQRLVPTLVAGGVSFAEISSGSFRSCGRTQPGAAYCWGLDDFTWGQNLPTYVPILVAGGISFVEISTGQAHTCGLTQAGAAYCWGDNSAGQLGDGTTTRRQAPTLVVGGISFVQISVGDGQSCGLTQAGVVYCWGDNRYAQLGDGTTTQRLVPTLVQSP